jgi:hypothetical protein
MKKFILFFTLICSFNSFASTRESKMICAYKNAPVVRDIVNKISNHDKFKHCAASCMLTLKCGIVQSISTGILKELWDVFTPGDASIEDLIADAFGVGLAKTRSATGLKECAWQCDNYYPMKIP